MVITFFSPLKALIPTGCEKIYNSTVVGYPQFHEIKKLAGSSVMLTKLQDILAFQPKRFPWAVSSTDNNSPKAFHHFLPGGLQVTPDSTGVLVSLLHKSVKSSQTEIRENLAWHLNQERMGKAIIVAHLAQSTGYTPLHWDFRKENLWMNRYKNLSVF